MSYTQKVTAINAIAATCLSVLASPVSAQSSTTYRYDALGRLLSTEKGEGTTSDYSHDLASNRSRATSTLQFLQAWPAQSPQIGHIVGRAEGDGWSARVEDSAGHMIFGPYTNAVPGGARVAAYRMLVDNNNANNSPVVLLDVWDATTGTQLAARQVSRMEWRAAGAYQVFELPFTLEAARVGHALEFRIYYQRSSYVRVERVGYR